MAKELHRIEITEATKLGELSEQTNRCCYGFGTEAKIEIREEEGKKFIAIIEKT